MVSVLGLGFLVGMRHAIEADHAAAIATLATKNYSVANTLKQGLTWGLGHTITLLLFGSMVFLLEAAVPERLANWLELAVGVMLVGLGSDVLRKIIQGRIHIHVHQHLHQPPQLHAHSHGGEINHQMTDHHHSHSTAFPYRALFVGLMHGMAGSAALILLTLQQTVSPLQGIIYIAIFGLGSMMGMDTLSMVITIPLCFHPGQYVGSQRAAGLHRRNHDCPWADADLHDRLQPLELNFRPFPKIGHCSLLTVGSIFFELQRAQVKRFNLRICNS